MKSKKLSFYNRNGVKLAARLDTPIAIDREPSTYALFAHCFTCNKDYKIVRHIAQALTQKHMVVLSVDFAGLGDSKGDFSQGTFSSNVTDLMDAAQYMARELVAPSLIIGHSLGGTAGIFAGSHIASVKAIVTIGSPAFPSHLLKVFQHILPTIQQEGQADIEIGGRTFSITQKFIDDLKQHDTKKTLQKLHLPLLFMHSPQDEVVEVENAAELYTHAVHPKSFVSLDHADHMLSNKADADYVGQLIATWVTRYIDRTKNSFDRH
jgi:putative redox protein